MDVHLTERDGQRSEGSSYLLNRLPPNEVALLRANARSIRLPVKTNISREKELSDLVTFPVSGMISLVASLTDGREVEVAAMGNEGAVGFEEVLAGEASPVRSIVQVATTVLQVPASVLRAHLAELPVLAKELARTALAVHEQAIETVACVAYHSLSERLATWLLLTSQYAQSRSLRLTQEFVSQMVAAQRPSVTLAAHVLRDAGAISYTYGTVTIIDDDVLARMACECHMKNMQRLARLRTS